MPVQIKLRRKYRTGGSAKGTKGGPKAAPKKTRKKNGPKGTGRARVMVMSGTGKKRMRDA